jgi:hypothetical protein
MNVERSMFNLFDECNTWELRDPVPLTAPVLRDT